MKHLAFIIVSVVITNCSNNNNDTKNKHLYGSWEGENQIWVFNEDGVAFINAHGFGKPTKANWFVNRNELNLLTKSGIKLIFDIKIDKDTLFYKSPKEVNKWFKLLKNS